MLLSVLFEYILFFSSMALVNIFAATVITKYFLHNFVFAQIVIILLLLSLLLLS